MRFFIFYFWFFDKKFFEKVHLVPCFPSRKNVLLTWLLQIPWKAFQWWGVMQQLERKKEKVVSELPFLWTLHIPLKWFRWLYAKRLKAQIQFQWHGYFLALPWFYPTNTVKWSEAFIHRTWKCLGIILKVQKFKILLFIKKKKKSQKTKFLSH